MADKKITALTDLGATAKDSAVDLLHIIDYSASPVNKKISVANLFSNVNTDTHIYGASKTFEVGFAAVGGLATATSALKITSGADNTTDQNVVINADGNAYTDFTVKSLNSDTAIKVDAGTDDVTINGGSNAEVDLTVNGDNGVNIYSDGGLDAVGIGTGTVDGTVTCTVAGDATTGHALKVTGNILMGETFALSAAGAVPLTKPVILASPDGTTAYTLADGTVGQIMTFICIAVPNTGAGTVTPASFAQGTSFALNAVGQTITLLFANSTWQVIGNHSVTIS
tara:strand:- start:1373 stop:2221 length:849 start_codon:yes stop_codon:yes gene_type:complete